MKNVFLISGPSGSGKGSVIEGLAKIMPIERVVTTTTRPMRPGESDGHPYHFISKPEFLKLKDEAAFVEYAEGYNNEWYGVRHADLQQAFLSKKVNFWEVDFKGVENIKTIYPTIKSFFIDAPEEVFRQRIIKRDNPSNEYLESRIQYVREWGHKKDFYDYIIKNDEGKLDQTINEIKTIIDKELSLS